jgi:hypothetical protein
LTINLFLPHLLLLLFDPFPSLLRSRRRAARSLSAPLSSRYVVRHLEVSDWARELGKPLARRVRFGGSFLLLSQPREEREEKRLASLVVKTHRRISAFRAGGAPFLLALAPPKGT